MGQRCSLTGIDAGATASSSTSRLPGSCICRNEMRFGCPGMDDQEACYPPPELGLNFASSSGGRWSATSRQHLASASSATAAFSRETSHVENMAIPHGGVYTGQVLADGQPEGSGCQRWPDGTVYTGRWRAGAAHGSGRLSKSDGSGFDGQWCEGRKHGVGSEWLVDQSEYSGEFADGQKHGAGAFRWASGASYTGQFCEDSLHGDGTFMWDDGRRYRGQWVQSRMHGQGRFEWPDGKSFEGRYELDKKHGPGVFTWSDGSKCIGVWLGGKQHGIGTHISEKGASRKGRWANGSLESWLDPPSNPHQPLVLDSDPEDVVQEPDTVAADLITAHA